MLWAKKRPPELPAASYALAPATLAVAFDAPDWSESDAAAAMPYPSCYYSAGMLAEFFGRNGVKQPQTFPMVRARLVAVNGKPVSAEDYSDERARRQIEREFNVTHMSELPPDNKVAAGAWFGPDDLRRGAISIEYWIAERFGIDVGDTLEFLGARRSILNRGLRYPERHGRQQGVQG